MKNFSKISNMIIVLSFAFFIIFVPCISALAQTCLSPPPGAIAWWSFDETSGTIAGDRIGDNVGGFAGEPMAVEGQVWGALHFDGNDYIAVADNDQWAFGANNFTIELWANFDAPGGGSIGHPSDIFIGNDEGPGTRNKWFFALGGGYLNFHINGPAVGSRFFPLVPFSPNVGQWYHLAVRRNGTTYTIFIDGVPSGSATDTRLIPNANAPLTIGQAEQIGFMNGRLDEVTIYNRALSDEEIQSIFDAGNAGKCIDLTIRPNKGGDTGSVSVNINGNEFVEGATVKFVKIGETDIIGNPVTVGENGTTIAVTFDLTGKARGAWDVVVDNPDSTSFILPEGFTIAEGHGAQLWADIIGLPVFRPGRSQKFFILYGNKGNVDSPAAFAAVSGIPISADVRIGFDFSVNVLPEPFNDPLPADTTIEIGNEKVLPLLLRRVPAGFTGILPIELTLSEAVLVNLIVYLGTL